MACLGVHFALAPDDAARLLALPDDASRLDFVQEQIEERYLEDPGTYAAESDKAWDAMHRALADGLLGYEGGDYPLSHVVLGGRSLYEDDDYILSFKTPEQVRDVAAAAEAVTREALRTRYDVIDPEAYGFELSDEDFDYTWDWFENVRALYRIAASEGRAMLFTADQ